MLTHNNTNKSEWRVVLCTRVKLIISHKKYTLPLFTGDEISHMSDSKEETKEMMLLTIHVHIQGCVLEETTLKQTTDIDLILSSNIF